MGGLLNAIGRAVIVAVAASVPCAMAHAGPVSFTFEGQLASGSEGAFQGGADYALTFVIENDSATIADREFDLADFLSLTLVSGAVEWDWTEVNATVPLFSGFQTNALGQLVMGSGVFLRAGLYDLATFTGGTFGAASLDGNDRATTAVGVPVSNVGVPVSVTEPALPTLLGIGVLAWFVRRRWSRGPSHWQEALVFAARRRSH